MSEVKLSGINHIALVTADMDRTIRFWRDLLGLTLSATFGEPGYRQYFFRIARGSYITFFEWTGAEAVEEKEHGTPFKGPIAFDHVAFGVEDKESLLGMKARLEASGEWVSEVIDHGFIHSIYAFDPNGIAIEFCLELEETDIGRDPVMADKEPTKAALEGPSPQPDKWPAPEGLSTKAEHKVYPGMGSEHFKKGLPT